MLTITVSARAAALTLIGSAALLAAGLYAPGVLGSGAVPDQVYQGDINCDEVVDQFDALGVLQYVAGLDVDQQEPCFGPGSIAAIPGPQGPKGDQGDPGPENVLHASINADGDIQAGDALGSAIDQFGQYRVTFGRDITSCAATVAPGSSFGGPNPIGFSTVALVHVVHAGQSNDETVVVAFRDQTEALPTFVQTDFHLIVAC